MDKIVWEVMEYEHKDRAPDWYWAVGIIALSSAVIAIVSKTVAIDLAATPPYLRQV